MAARHGEGRAGFDPTASGTATRGYGARPLIVMAALFFIIGFVTWLNGPLITFVQVAFGLGPVGAFLVPMCFYLSYFFCAIPAMGLARRTGLRNGIMVALAVMAGGTLAFGNVWACAGTPARWRACPCWGRD